MSFPLEGAGMLWIWIQLLYRDPTARVQVNSFLSAPFSLHRETRQVCPLSPGFFRLDLDQRVRGLQIGLIQEKISLYADNTLLYLADSRVSLQSALEIIDQFGDTPVSVSIGISWFSSPSTPWALGQLRTPSFSGWRSLNISGWGSEGPCRPTWKITFPPFWSNSVGNVSCERPSPCLQ